MEIYEKTKVLVTASDVLLRMAHCMAKVWKNPIILDKAKDLLEKEGSEDTWYKLVLKELTLQVSLKCSHKGTKSWVNIKLMWDGPDTYELHKIKWAFLPDGLLVQRYLGYYYQGHEEKFQPCLTWNDIETELATRFPSDPVWELQYEKAEASKASNSKSEDTKDANETL